MALIILVWLSQQRARRAAGAFKALSEQHPSLTMRWEQDGPPPTSLRYPVLLGKWQQRDVRVQYTGPPNAGKGRSISHCQVTTAFSHLPEFLEVRPAAPFEMGERVKTGSQDFDVAFVVRAKTPSDALTWLNRKRQELLLQYLGQCDSVRINANEGLVVHFRRLKADEPQLKSSMDQATLWAHQLDEATS